MWPGAFPNAVSSASSRRAHQSLMLLKVTLLSSKIQTKAVLSQSFSNHAWVMPLRVVKSDEQVVTRNV